MNILKTTIDLLIIWAAATAAFGFLLLAMRTRNIQREHGLRRSRHHLTAAITVFGVMAAVAIGGTFITLFQTSGGSLSTQKMPSVVQLNPTVEQLAVLERERIALEEKLSTLRRQIESFKEANANGSDKHGTESTAPFSDASNTRPELSLGGRVPTTIFVITFAIILADVALLLFLGDRDVIVGLLLGMPRTKGELRLKTLANLELLITAADKGEFLQGLEYAANVDPHLLGRYESMDLLFLRAYCAVQCAMSGNPDANREVNLEEAVRSLTSLLEEAPNHTEAVYLLATAVGFQGDFATALERFAEAESANPKSDLPFAHNKSVCMLRLAEERLNLGDADESSRLFDRVSQLNKLADRIPTTLVRVRLSRVQHSIHCGRFSEAADGIQAVRRIEGLDQEFRLNVEIVCDAMQTLASLRETNDHLVVRQIDDFLSKHFPAGLPQVDEDIADEYLEPPISGIDLRVDARVFGAFLFLKSAVLARSVAKTGSPPTIAQATEIINTLLMALQFELRQRDVLAALGGVHYWFVPEKREKAVRWLQSAVVLGVKSQIARRILDRDQQIEEENREALEWFRSATGRFLHDPTVSSHVRQALIEELGRFRGFQPMLLELDQQTDLDSEEPTVRLLRERAEYMQQVVSDFAKRKSAVSEAQLGELREEYTRLIAVLDTSAGRMAEIERRFVQEVGKSVLT